MPLPVRALTAEFLDLVLHKFIRPVKMPGGATKENQALLPVGQRRQWLDFIDRPKARKDVGALGWVIVGRYDNGVKATHGQGGAHQHHGARIMVAAQCVEQTVGTPTGPDDEIRPGGGWLGWPSKNPAPERHRVVLAFNPVDPGATECCQALAQALQLAQVAGLIVTQKPDNGLLMAGRIGGLCRHQN